MTTSSKNISAPQVRTIRDSQTTTIPVQTATASYVDLAGSKVDARNSSSVAFVLKNAHGSLTSKYKILASIDDVTYVEVQAEATLTAAGGTGGYVTTAPAYNYYKAQLIDGSGHGTLEGSVVTKD